MTVLLFLRRVDCNDGVASYCETIVRGLVERGNRVLIISGPVTQLYGSAIRHAAIRARVLDWLVFADLGSARPTLATIRAILAAIRAHEVDVVSPQGFSLLPLAFLVAKLARRPIVANYHPSMTGRSPGIIATDRSARMKLAYRAIAGLFPADRFIAISKEIAGFYRTDCAIRTDRIVHIPHGIDLSYFRPPTPDERARARQAHGLTEDALACILPGRLNFDKGHDVAIDAVRRLRASHPRLRVVCLFPGGGDQADAIRAYAHREDADAAAFRFLGFLDAQAFRAAYWAADIGLLPSRFEGFGQVIAEAMSCGCVPIRTPSGGWDDQIVDRENGFVIPFNDPAALADRIAILSDASVRAPMRERALAFAAGHFDQRVMVAATADLYRTVATPLLRQAAC
jgi:glycosyltransferase involved in cell wall biosynthesis